MTILEIINLIESDKRSRNIVPCHALILEIIKKAQDIYPVFTRDIVTAELKELVKQKVISLGDTINDKYITIL